MRKHHDEEPLTEKPKPAPAPQAKRFSVWYHDGSFVVQDDESDGKPCLRTRSLRVEGEITFERNEASGLVARVVGNIK